VRNKLGSDKILTLPDNKGVNASPYDEGEKILMNCILLSKTNLLVGTLSNLYVWARYFNPDLPYGILAPSNLSHITLYIGIIIAVFVTIILFIRWKNRNSHHWKRLPSSQNRDKIDREEYH